MDVTEAIRSRRSIRRYKQIPVPEHLLKRVLEAARLAPSAGNRQEWKFVVITEEETKRQLAEACRNQSFVAQAGAVIVACATDPSKKWHMVDVAIAVDHMTLEAHALGLGSCWIGAYEEERVKQICGIPEAIRVVVLLPVGIPDAEGVTRPRKTLEEIVSWERWT
jgi:nitroreductase